MAENSSRCLALKIILWYGHVTDSKRPDSGESLTIVAAANEVTACRPDEIFTIMAFFEGRILLLLT
jgi:hypothetical protein